MRKFSLGIDIGSVNTYVSARIGNDDPILLNVGRKITEKGYKEDEDEDEKEEEKEEEDAEEASFNDIAPDVFFFPSVVYIPKKRKPIVGEKALFKKEDRKLRNIRKWLFLKSDDKPKWLIDDRIVLGDYEYPFKYPFELIIKEATMRAKRVLKKDKIWKRNTLFSDIPLNLTCSSSLSPERKQILVDIAKGIGFNMYLNNLIDEPAATAVAIAHHSEILLSGKILIVIIGSVSLEVAFVNIDPQTKKIHILAEDSDLVGGENLDNAIIQFIKEQFFKKYKVDIPDSDLSEHKNPELYDIVREAKIRLSSEDNVVIELANFAEKKKVKFTLTKAEFEKRINKYIRNIEEVINRAFRKLLLNVKGKADPVSSQSINDWVDKVLLLGGSSRVPAIQRMIEKKFESKEIITDTSLGYLNLASVGATYQDEYKNLTMPYPTYSIFLSAQTENGTEEVKVFSAFSEIYPWYLTFINALPRYEKDIRFSGKIKKLEVMYETVKGEKVYHPLNSTIFVNLYSLSFKLDPTGVMLISDPTGKNKIMVTTPPWYYFVSYDDLRKNPPKEFVKERDYTTSSMELYEPEEREYETEDETDLD